MFLPGSKLASGEAAVDDLFAALRDQVWSRLRGLLVLCEQQRPTVERGGVQTGAGSAGHRACVKVQAGFRR